MSTTTRLTDDQLSRLSKEFPIGQNFHSGRFGWRRVGGCLNLSACQFFTELEAEADRDSVLVDHERYTAEESYAAGLVLGTPE